MMIGMKHLTTDGNRTYTHLKRYDQLNDPYILRGDDKLNQN